MASPHETPQARATMAAFRLVAWQRPPELVEVPVPVAGPGQVVVEVAGCGLCHSDLTMATMPAEVGEALGWRVPFTLGHETAGRVVEIGPPLSSERDGAITVIGADGATVRPPTPLAVGDAVAVCSPASCGECVHCRAGRDSACRAGSAGRGFGRDGGLARYVLVEGGSRELVPLGDLDPRHAGPLTDAGATSMHAVRRALDALGGLDGLGPGSSVAVIGIGGLGSFVVQIVRALTSARVIALDVAAARREAALRLGAAVALDGGAERVHREVRAAGGEDGVDAVLDVVGTDATIATGLRSLRRGGAFVLVGAGGGGYARPWFGGLPREATITTVQGSSRADVRAVVDLAARGQVTVEVDEFPLADAGAAYAALDAGALRGRAVVIP